MKFGIVCDVEGKTYLKNGLSVEHDGVTYIFYVTDEGLLKQIRLISEVDDPNLYFYQKSPVQNDGSFTVNYGFEEHIRGKLVEELQRLESMLAIVGNIKRVYWNKPTYEYYPQTEAEHARFNVMPPWFFLHEMTVDDPKAIDKEHLMKLVEQRELFRPFVIPMAFMREAKTEYSAARYVNAFFNSYFVIEGLFGNGQWRSDAVVRELFASPTFVSFVNDFLDKASLIDDPDQGLTKDQLISELKSRGQGYDAVGLIKLIVKKRGDLHHFSLDSIKLQGTPLNNSDFKTISLVAFTLAGNALMSRLDEHAKSLDAKSRDGEKNTGVTLIAP